MSTTAYSSIKDWKCAHHFPGIYCVVRTHEKEKEKKHTHIHMKMMLFVLFEEALFCCRFVCHCRQFSLIASLVVSFIYYRHEWNSIFPPTDFFFHHACVQGFKILRTCKYIKSLFVLWFAVIVFQLHFGRFRFQQSLVHHTLIFSLSYWFVVSSKWHHIVNHSGIIITLLLHFNFALCGTVLMQILWNIWILWIFKWKLKCWRGLLCDPCEKKYGC